MQQYVLLVFYQEVGSVDGHGLADGENACVGGGFAQCVGGKWTIVPCAGGLQCFALPLVNSDGTSITCTTSQDAQSRIAATGVQGGITGGGRSTGGVSGNGYYDAPASAPSPDAAAGNSGYGDYYGAPPANVASPAPQSPPNAGGQPIATLVPARPADGSDNARVVNPPAGSPIATLSAVREPAPIATLVPAANPNQRTTQPLATLVPAPGRLRVRQFGTPPAETVSTLSTTLPPVPITIPGSQPSVVVPPPIVVTSPAANPVASAPAQVLPTTVTVIQTTTVTLVVGAPATPTPPVTTIVAAPTVPAPLNDPFTTIASIPQSAVPPVVTVTLSTSSVAPVVTLNPSSSAPPGIVAPVQPSPAPVLVSPSSSVAQPIATLIPARPAPPTITPPPANADPAPTTFDISSLISKTLSF